MPRKARTEEGEDEPVGRDVREMAQAIASVEVAVCIIAVFALLNRAKRLAQAVEHLRALADHAVYQRDGLDPTVLDRIADRIETGQAATGR
jgi:hypothetical protein